MTTIATNQITAGDVNILTLTLTKIAGGTPFTFLGQVQSIDLFEDIEAPALYMEIHIADGIGMLKSLPIVGEEWVDIEFQTPTRPSYKARFHVHQVVDIVSLPNQTMQFYTIRCVSEETYVSASTLIEKGYHDTIDNMIGDIIQSQLGSSKSYFYEQTKGPQQIAFTRKSPWDAIKMLTKRACSQTSLSSSFFFYENKYGFNFNTLEYLMDKNSGAIGDKIFTRYTALATQNESNLLFRHIVDYKTGSQFNMLNSIREGALNNIHHSFDLITKELTSKQYTLPSFSDFSTADPSGAVSPFTPSIYSSYGSNTAIRYYSLNDSSKPDTYIPDFLSGKIGYLATQLQGTLDIHVYGDSAISIGDVVTIEVPKTSGMTKTTIDPEPLVGGNYIVAKARHRIQVGHEKPKYTLGMTLIRGTYKQ